MAKGIEARLAKLETTAPEGNGVFLQFTRRRGESLDFDHPSNQWRTVPPMRSSAIRGKVEESVAF